MQSIMVLITHDEAQLIGAMLQNGKRNRVAKWNESSSNSSASRTRRALESVKTILRIAVKVTIANLLIASHGQAGSSDVLSQKISKKRGDGAKLLVNYS